MLKKRQPKGHKQNKKYPSEWTISMRAALEEESIPRYTYISESSMELSEPSLNSSDNIQTSQSKSEESVSESMDNQDFEQTVSLSSQETDDSVNSNTSYTASRTNSIATIGSADLTIGDSETSGYTTESSYHTSIEGSYTLVGSSYNSLQTTYGPGPGNFLREIHVGINSNATFEQIDGVLHDLRELLTNEIAFIHQAGDFRPAIYLIAYHYM